MPWRLALLGVALEPIECGDEEGAVLGAHLCLDGLQPPDVGVNALSFVLCTASELACLDASLVENHASFAMGLGAELVCGALGGHQGLRALIRASGVEGKAITAGRVGFILAPRLNAAGRVGHAMLGVELLLSDSEPESNRIARELEEMNRRRQDIDRATLEEARRKIDAIDLDNTFGIVLAEQGWHPGVIGIVASRIVEETARPTVLIALDGNEGKGSGRAPGPFDLHAGLSDCRDLLVRFGGHKAAAGVMSGSRPLPEVVTRSTGTWAPLTSVRMASAEAFTRSTSALEVGPRFDPLEAAAS